MRNCLICNKSIEESDITYSVKDIVLITDGICHKTCGDKYKEKSLAGYEISDDKGNFIKELLS
ncbi:hypothetical protein N9948_01910 [bacterium]|nr:hypothetical protein [bacterium]